jgi:hypothetical protein
MPTQSNNFILIERDAASPIRGQQRSIDASDDIVLSPATLSIAPTGNVAINSTSGTLSLGTTASTQAINIGTAGARVITIGQGAGTGPTIVLNGTTNSLDLSSSSALNLATGGSTAEFQAPTINIGTESSGDYANTNINLGTSSSVIALALKDNQSSAFSISEAGTKYIDLSTANGAEELVLSAPNMMVGSASGAKLTIPAETTVGTQVENGSGSILAVGTVVSMKATGTPSVGGSRPYVSLADANATDVGERSFAGVVVESIAIGDTGRAASIQGSVVAATFLSASKPSAGQRGLPCYLSTTPGKLTMTAPDVPGVRVFIVGYVVSTTAVSGDNFYIQLMPQVIADVPV